jgi:CDP-L-myo-inositol myo-inositolphosphotransferase
LRAVVIFRSQEAARQLIAGIPAAARAVHEAALAGAAECWLLVQGGNIGAAVLIEAERLAAPAALRVGSLDRLAELTGAAVLVSGERQVEAATIRRALGGPARPEEGALAAEENHAAAALELDHSWSKTGYAARSATIVAATTKPQDGIVSRLFNRPVSQAISRQLLHFAAVRPAHATVATAAIGLVMYACLVLLPGTRGLVAGALLFQAASVIDGVDGEIARATHRTTRFGALLDSLVDAATNLSFVAGVVFNFYRQGQLETATIGFAGLVALALGLSFIGLHARRSRGPFTFNLVKDRVGATGSSVARWLTWLTMRDFYALAAVLLILTGLGAQAVMAFAVIAAGWLAVVIATLVRQPA